MRPRYVKILTRESDGPVRLRMEVMHQIGACQELSTQ
jgi:hypothetical protein